MKLFSDCLIELQCVIMVYLMLNIICETHCTEILLMFHHGLGRRETCFSKRLCRLFFFSNRRISFRSSRFDKLCILTVLGSLNCSVNNNNNNDYNVSWSGACYSPSSTTVFFSNIKDCCSVFCISTYCQNCEIQMQPQLVYITFYCRCVQRSPNIYYNIIFIAHI